MIQSTSATLSAAITDGDISTIADTLIPRWRVRQSPCVTVGIADRSPLR
jgi:hypothetical protein